jgi:hypothetical protein
MRSYKLVIVIIGLIMLKTNYVKGQNFVPYKDDSNGLWGIKNIKNNKIITPGLWQKIRDFDYNDSIFVVHKDLSYYAVVDTNFKFKINYTNTYLCLNASNYYFSDYPYDTINKKRLVEYPFINARKEPNWHILFIDYNLNCLPEDYYPCPDWKQTKDVRLPKHLELIQQGERKIWNRDIDSAVYYCKLAIQVDSMNPSIYYWGANIFFDHLREDKTLGSIGKYKIYFSWIKYCLDKADSLEKLNPYKSWILYRKYNFYKDILKDKKVAKEINERYKIVAKGKK